MEMRELDSRMSDGIQIPYAHAARHRPAPVELLAA
jgi:hypothetical protein